MIGYIRGTITHKNPTFLLVECGGIGYHIFVSLNTYGKLQDKNEAKIYTHLHITESAHSLYGFADQREKDLFVQLISVSGIGASTAMLALSSMTPEELQSAIVHENETAIQKIKGIGPKSAKRMILELKDKLSKLPVSSSMASVKESTHKEQALSALIALGFNKAVAEKAIAKAHDSGQDVSGVEQLIKLSLKSL